MAKLAGSERLAWKSKLDQSEWVDSTPWLDDEGRTETDPQIEFLEAEPSAYRLSNTVLKTKEKSDSQWAKIVGIGGVAVVLIALAIMSQPGDNDPFDQLPPAEQQIIRQRQAREAREAAGLPPEEFADEVAAPELGEPSPAIEDDPEPAAPGDAAAGDTAEVAPKVLEPIPALRQDLPPTFSGPLFAYGLDGSMVRIDPALEAPEETVVEMASAAKANSQGLSLGSVFAVQAEDRLWRYGSDGSLVEVGGFPGGEVFPADDGGLVGVRGRSNSQLALLLTAAEGYEVSEESLRWEIGGDLDVLGAWRGRLLVAKAGNVWLLGEANRYSSVTQGQVLSYDGRHLAMLNCVAPNDCRIQVGTPDQPRQRSVVVTGDLGTLSLRAWTHSVAVSPDGSRIAFNQDRGAVALPVWVDMETGEQTAIPDSMNHSSPLVWSPDGNWLAYAFTDDVVVWSIEERRAWRIMTNRSVNYLGWHEAGAESEQPGEAEE